MATEERKVIATRNRVQTLLPRLKFMRKAFIEKKLTKI